MFLYNFLLFSASCRHFVMSVGFYISSRCSSRKNNCIFFCNTVYSVMCIMARIVYVSADVDKRWNSFNIYSQLYVCARTRACEILKAFLLTEITKPDGYSMPRAVVFKEDYVRWKGCTLLKKSHFLDIINVIYVYSHYRVLSN